MSECVRGCTTWRRHVATCPVADRSETAWVPAADPGSTDEAGFFDADRCVLDPRIRADVWVNRYGGLERPFTCRGCLPREAAHGHLCEHCHHRLVSWLDELPTLYRWLSMNMTPGGGSSARQDWQRPAASEELPSPVRIAVLDVRTLLTDRVLELEDCARDVFDRPARRGRFALRHAVQFLHAWLGSIEKDLDLVVHAFELLEDLFRRARMVAPWEDRPRRIAGITCPQCDRAALEVRPGMEDVTCRNCRAVIPRQRYDIWTRVLAEEAKAAG